MAGEERHLMHGSYMYHGKGPVPMMQPVPGPASMSVTWPRGYGGSMLGGGGGAPPPHAPTMMSMMNSNPVSLRASQQQQISADVSKAVGAGRICVDERERERVRERESEREIDIESEITRD